MSNLKDIAKTIPKNILHDKERLYEELIKTKSVVNLLQNENYRLRASNI